HARPLVAGAARRARRAGARLIEARRRHMPAGTDSAVVASRAAPKCIPGLEQGASAPMAGMPSAPARSPLSKPLVSQYMPHCTGIAGVRPAGCWPVSIFSGYNPAMIRRGTLADLPELQELEQICFESD